MPPPPRHPLDKNVSPKWNPIVERADYKPGMTWSDRLWHWLVSLGGLCIVGVGVAVTVYTFFRRVGVVIIAMGFAVFIRGFPSQAQRNGYRE